MRPLVPHYDSIYNTYWNLYNRRAIAHNVLNWYVWRGRNLKSFRSHIRNIEHMISQKSRMVARMRSVFQMALSQCLIFRLGFNHMGNVGVFIWNEFRHSVGGRLRDSPQTRGVGSPHLGIRDKWALCALYRREVLRTRPHGLADDQTYRNDHSPQKQLVSPEQKHKQQSKLSHD